MTISKPRRTLTDLMASLVEYHLLLAAAHVQAQQMRHRCDNGAEMRYPKHSSMGQAYGRVGAACQRIGRLRWSFQASGAARDLHKSMSRLSLGDQLPVDAGSLVYAYRHASPIDQQPDRRTHKQIVSKSTSTPILSLSSSCREMLFVLFHK